MTISDARFFYSRRGRRRRETRAPTRAVTRKDERKDARLNVGPRPRLSRTRRSRAPFTSARRVSRNKETRDSAADLLTFTRRRFPRAFPRDFPRRKIATALFRTYRFSSDCAFAGAPTRIHGRGWSALGESGFEAGASWTTARTDAAARIRSARRRRWASRRDREGKKRPARVTKENSRTPFFFQGVPSTRVRVPRLPNPCPRGTPPRPGPSVS